MEKNPAEREPSEAEGPGGDPGRTSPHDRIPEYERGQRDRSRLLGEERSGPRDPGEEVPAGVPQLKRRQGQRDREEVLGAAGPRDQAGRWGQRRERDPGEDARADPREI